MALGLFAACVVCVLACSGEQMSRSARDRQPPDRAAETALTTTRTFTDVTEAAGVVFEHVSGAQGEFWLPEEMGAGGALLDYDADGDLDLYLVQSGVIGGDDPEHANRLYENDGTGHFTDVTAGAGAGVAGHGVPGYGMGCAAADVDDDGDVDLYVTRLGPNVLLLNQGDGTFEDATADAGVADSGFGASAAFFDYDRDGKLDLYVTNYVDWTPGRETTCFDPRGLRDYCNPMEYEAPSRDRLYRGGGDGTFEDVTTAAGIASAAGNGLGVLATDVNGDGWVDLYVANDQTPGFLWVNQGDGTFLEDAAFSGAAFNEDGIAIAGMGVAAEDLDGDLDFDVVVTNIHDQAHLALRNDGGLFTDVSHAWGFGGWGVPYTGFGMVLFDQDHDGRLEGFVANGAVNRLTEPRRPGHPYAEPNQFLRRDARGRFYDASGEVGAALEPHEMSRGVLMGDLDQDGDIDLVVTNNHGPTRVLRNDAASSLAWTMLELRTGAGKRHALNARVAVEAAGATYVREVRPHTSYLCSNDPRVHVGLGSARAVDRMTVTWPDGTVEAWSDLPVRKHLRVVQGRSPAFEVPSVAESP